MKDGIYIEKLVLYLQGNIIFFLLKMLSISKIRQFFPTSNII